MRFHSIGQILLIGKHQDNSVPHLPVINDAMEFLSRLVHAVPVCAVHHKDEALRTRVVVSPQWPDLVLPAHIPNIEFDVLIGYCLDIEADCGDSSDRMAQFELVQDGGLARRVQAKHQDADLFVSKDLAQ